MAVVGPAYQGSAGIAEYVAGERPFADANDLRSAMQDRLFALAPEQQRALMEQYPSLAARRYRPASSATSRSSTRPRRV